MLTELLQRKKPKLVAVALANKIARVAWKLMVSGEKYRRVDADLAVKVAQNLSLLIVDPKKPWTAIKGLCLGMKQQSVDRRARSRHRPSNSVAHPDDANVHIPSIQDSGKAILRIPCT
ncbi:hypothetical protein SAMN05216228_102480 [Rhizobium tibeticum]|uniref:Transposase IS116/IS110/IS902 family protein n=1 Tax=Rhizobium tibeticum TaxID=501024 RepID=A0A1H8SF22_9HYPH|nr:hypothetical protein RTCCBAU85039_4817 [Rhizobium tibeticum]SEO77175.1 hypothetical protein SAMN05216228_102480 [Rhizobium tibeticum]